MQKSTRAMMDNLLYTQHMLRALSQCLPSPTRKMCKTLYPRRPSLTVTTCGSGPSGSPLTNKTLYLHQESLSRVPDCLTSCTDSLDHSYPRQTTETEVRNGNHMMEVFSNFYIKIMILKGKMAKCLVHPKAQAPSSNTQLLAYITWLRFSNLG